MQADSLEREMAEFNIFEEKGRLRNTVVTCVCAIPEHTVEHSGPLRSTWGK